MDILTGIVINLYPKRLFCDVQTDDGRRLQNVVILKPGGSKSTGISAFPKIGERHILFLDQRFNRAYLGPPCDNEIIDIKEEVGEGECLIFADDGSLIKVYKQGIIILKTNQTERGQYQDEGIISDKCLNYFLFTAGGKIEWIVDDNNNTDYIMEIFTKMFENTCFKMEVGNRANVFKLKIANMEIAISKTSKIDVKNNQYQLTIDPAGNLNIKTLNYQQKSMMIDITADGVINIQTPGICNIRASMVNIGNAPTGLVINNTTHPVCYATGLPILPCATVSAGP